MKEAEILAKDSGYQTHEKHVGGTTDAQGGDWCLKKFTYSSLATHPSSWYNLLAREYMYICYMPISVYKQRSTIVKGKEVNLPNCIY